MVLLGVLLVVAKPIKPIIDNYRDEAIGNHTVPLKNHHSDWQTLRHVFQFAHQNTVRPPVGPPDTPPPPTSSTHSELCVGGEPPVESI